MIQQYETGYHPWFANRTLRQNSGRVRQLLLPILSACLLQTGGAIADTQIVPSFVPLPTEIPSASTAPLPQEKSRQPSQREKAALAALSLRDPHWIARCGLTEVDDSPLAERSPLILVHGIGGDENRLFDWGRFLSATEHKGDFQKRYKIYLYRYDSRRSVPTVSGELQARLHDFIRTLGGRNIKLLAYSEGGLLVRNAMQDAYLDEHTAEVLTIATPFHGSPLANPVWLQSQMKTESPFSLVRLGQRQAYAIARRKYPTFRQDFHWDNFDGAMPSVQLGLNTPSEPQLDYALARKKHFTAYGSYFGLEVDPTVLPKVLGLQEPPPRERPMVINLFRKNFLFSLIRNNIGRLPLIQARKDTVSTAQSESLAMAAVQTSIFPASVPGIQTGVHAVQMRNSHPSASLISESIPNPTSMMMFNDGISPISSTLWLGRYLPRRTPGAVLPMGRLWDALRSLKGSPNVRLFAGLDHRNWMEGSTRTGQETLRDLLNPNEPPRTVFEWIIYDLMT